MDHEGAVTRLKDEAPCSLNLWLGKAVCEKAAGGSSSKEKKISKKERRVALGVVVKKNKAFEEDGRQPRWRWLRKKIIGRVST